MNKKVYLLIKNEEYIYSFVSNGRNGEIIEAIIFQKMELLVFNLVLADFDLETQLLNDNAASNNNDIPKIMATVFQAIVLFLNSHQACSIYIEANTQQKNLLYNRIFKNYYSEFNSKYVLKGQNEDKVEDYHLGKPYKSFYICLKK